MKNENGLPSSGHDQWENLARTHSEHDCSPKALLKRHVSLSSGGFWPVVGIIFLVAVFFIYQCAV
jgi:hypothetical protein